MPLEIPWENEIVSRGKGKQPQHSEHMIKRMLDCHIVYFTNKHALYYPGCGDDTHILAHIEAQLDLNNPNTDVDNYVNETEEDWMGDNQIAKGQTYKFSESVATEVCVWCCFLLVFDLTSTVACHSGASGRE